MFLIIKIFIRLMKETLLYLHGNDILKKKHIFL